VSVGAPIGTLVLSHGCLPHSASGLQLGRVVSLTKGGLASCPSNFRSIPLLSVAYKILAQILATRFTYAFQLCVGPHQTAFIQGRKIGDSIFAAELLGSALAAEQLSGAAF
jgi:hypothetical protein